MNPSIAVGMHNLHRISNAQTRSISPENFTGEPGKGGMAETGPALYAARELGQGWKVSPYVVIQPGETFTLGRVEDQGAIQHIWITLGGEITWRNSILRMYWDGEETPSVECPIGDFFCNGWESYAPVRALPVCVNPGRAFNCYWTMPFREGFAITLENRNAKELICYYQIDYTLCPVEEDAGTFHAQFRRTNPLPYGQVYTVLDGVRGQGQYVGTYMAWGSNNNGWWGEGEIKFYMDGDREFPTICGTGTEDYFCGSYNFENGETHQYETFTTPYSGLCQVIRPDGLYRSQTRFGMYRFHVADPIRFQQELRVTIQALGWRSGGRYLPLMDDIASVAFWYQQGPHTPFPDLGSANDLEVN